MPRLSVRERDVPRRVAAADCCRRLRFPAAARALSACLSACLLIACLATASCVGGNEGSARTLVAVDIVPLAQICRSVGGEWVEVEVLVPPGASPHSYELSSDQMKSLERADLLVLVGLGLIPWEEEIFTKIGREGLPLIEAGQQIPAGELIPAGEEHAGDKTGEHGEEGSHGDYDPHVWLDPILAEYIVEAVRDGLSRVDPEHASAYRDNAASFLEELATLHAEIARRTASFSRREFIAFHSSWNYFARRYGLLQVGVIEERPGKEPSAGEIAELVELARERKVRAVFAEEQFSSRAAEAVAEESGGEVRVWKLDPLGDLGHPEKGDYCGLMRYNLSIMEEALR